MDKQYYVYILASRKNGTLYIGITSDLIRRIWEHKNKVVEGFTSKYNADELLYYEIFGDPENAINREKRLKFYKRKWKIDLIEKSKP
jgi:putative endonuclease